MPTPTRANIQDRIGDILDTVSSSVIAVKYRYLEAKPSVFPASMITYGGSQIETLDTRNNLVTYVFNVHLIFPEDDSAAAQVKWQQALDTVIAALNTYANLVLSNDAANFSAVGDDAPAFSDQFGGRVAHLNIRTSTKVVQSI